MNPSRYVAGIIFLVDILVHILSYSKNGTILRTIHRCTQQLVSAILLPKSLTSHMLDGVRIDGSADTTMNMNVAELMCRSSRLEHSP